MLTFRQFGLITEGGNIKVGDVSANDITMTPKNRPSVTNDIHDALHAMHNAYHSATGNHLFGKDAKGLKTGSIFAGSTNHLMDKNISHAEFAKHKPKVGDLDIKINRDHADDFIANHAKPGTKFGKYTVVGSKKGAGTHHLLMKHDNGEVHQFDMMKAEYHDHEPSKFEQMSNNSNWQDVKSGIKGKHHKILLNAAGRSTHKFSTMYGLGSRTDAKKPWINDPKEITHELFGPKANHGDIDSFHGVTQLIKKHIPKQHHQEIYDKFKADVLKQPGDHEKAIDHLRTHLEVKD